MRTFAETKTHEVTVDVVILTIINNAIQVLLVKRENEPFKGKWAIPGGYVRMSEDLDAAAMRILKEKTNVDNIYLEQLYTFGCEGSILLSNFLYPVLSNPSELSIS